MDATRWPAVALVRRGSLTVPDRCGAPERCDDAHSQLSGPLARTKRNIIQHPTGVTFESIHDYWSSILSPQRLSQNRRHSRLGQASPTRRRCAVHLGSNAQQVAPPSELTHPLHRSSLPDHTICFSACSLSLSRRQSEVLRHRNSESAAWVLLLVRLRVRRVAVPFPTDTVQEAAMDSWHVAAGFGRSVPRVRCNAGARSAALLDRDSRDAIRAPKRMRPHSAHSRAPPSRGQPVRAVPLRSRCISQRGTSVPVYT